MVAPLGRFGGHCISLWYAARNGHGGRGCRRVPFESGNFRVDPDGNYITHLGVQGGGEGEFSFTNTGGVEPFAGSIAVDGEGFIYVADVGNQRIQKFAP